MMRRLFYLCLGVASVAACGAVKNPSLPDAPPGVDASVRGTVHVTVLDAGGTGAPAVGATVVFIDPDGTLVKRAATDTNGKADADVLPGASVTSVALLNTTTQIQTVLAVQPGDQVTLGTKSADSSSAGTFTVSFPAFVGAVHYAVIHPCGFALVSPVAGTTVPPTSAIFTITNSCKRDTMELIVTPLDDNFNAIAAITKTVTFVANSSTTIAGSYQSVRSFTASYTNLTNIANLTLNRTVPDGFGWPLNLSMQAPPASLVLNATTNSVPGTTATINTIVSTAARSTQQIRQNIPGTALTYGLDAGALLLPWLGQATFDAANHKLVVPLDTTGTSSAKPDAFRIAASYRRVDANQVSSNFTWTLFAPEAGDISLPTLPPELAAIAPTASDTVNVTASMIEADTVTGYDAIRNNLNAAFLLYGNPRAPAGTVRISTSPTLLRL